MSRPAAPLSPRPTVTATRCSESWEPPTGLESPPSALRDEYPYPISQMNKLKDLLRAPLLARGRAGPGPHICLALKPEVLTQGLDPREGGWVSGKRVVGPPLERAGHIPSFWNLGPRNRAVPAEAASHSQGSELVFLFTLDILLHL